MKKIIPVLILFLIVLFFFKPFLFDKKLPIPSDTIIGLYHPFRDLYANNYPNGIPFKNFLITDPVRQQIPWKKISIAQLKSFSFPLWNPYNFSGTPLLANFQSSVFYPFNLFFFFLSFDIAWSILIILQPLLVALFMYLYLDNLKMHKIASFFGAIIFSFCGFFIAWMEWGTIANTALWLPLILLSIDKIFIYFQNSNFQLKNKKLIIWCLIFLFSLITSFFAGHLQIFFYLFLLSFVYFFARWIQAGKKLTILILFFIFLLLFLIFTAVQWIPTLQFILLSARDVNQLSWQNPGWFIPWQHLIQFVAPDFFGNPTTLNYWGIWNYGELVGYIGIIPLIMAFFALFFRRDKKTIFYGSVFFLSLIFSLPTFIAKLPFNLNIPFISTSQPTRLLFLTDFSLAILSAFGFDYFIFKRKKIIYPIVFLALIFISLWVFIFFGKRINNFVSLENISIAKNNLIFPTIIFFISVFTLLPLIIFKKINKNITMMICIIIVMITIFDLLRFGLKFTPFTNKEYLFPNTKLINFLKSNIGDDRFMSTDSRILPPNFSTVYNIQSIDGYDPLYLKNYGSLMFASQNSKTSELGFGFDRIITPQNFESKIIDLLGVKYVLSLSDLSSKKLIKVFQEGQTRVYENKKVMPRVFFVDKIQYANNKNEAISVLINHNFDLLKTAIVEQLPSEKLGEIQQKKYIIGKVKVLNYSENKILIETESPGDGFLVLTDSFYPTWHVKTDGKETKIYKTDYNFRGIFVPSGKHEIEFYIALF